MKIKLLIIFICMIGAAVGGSLSVNYSKSSNASSANVTAPQVANPQLTGLANEK